jgi:type VI secretion system protein ImpA
MVDVEVLLAQTAEFPPCGPDLEYDPAFLALEEAARGRPEGMTGQPAEEPRWPDVLMRAEGLLHRCKDLRVAVPLTRALTNLDGIPGLVQGLSVVAGLLERYWSEVHPQLGDDVAPRLNTLASLADTDPEGGLVWDLRRAFVIKSREHGAVRVRDVEVALGKLPARRGEPAASLETLRAQLAAAFARDGAVLRAATEARQALDRIRTIVADRVGIARAPKLDALENPLTAVVLFTPAEAPPKSEDRAGEALEPAPAPATVGVSGGPIRNRDEALRALDLVCQYFERYEPSHPAPLFIRRAQRLITKDFVEIVRDLIPDSIKQLETLAGGFEEKP